MLTLLEVLRSTMPKESANVVSDDINVEELSKEDMMRLATETKKTKFCTIVFVERRFTAKIVYMVLKVIALLCGAHYVLMVLSFHQLYLFESCYRQVCICGC
jgi:Lhr-like helicase